MMLKNIFAAFALVMTSATMAFGQDIYVGARIGGFGSDWENTGSFPVLKSRSTVLWTFNLYARQEVMEDLYMGIDLGFSRSNAQLDLFQPERNVPKGSGPSLALWSIGPTVRKDFFLPEGKVGFHTSLSIPLNHTPFENYEYPEGYFRTVVNASGEPTYDIFVYGESLVNRRFSVFIRPEVGLFYNLNERGRISVDAMWGINTGGPLVTRDFHEVIYEGQTYTDNYHEYNGQYLAFTIGYEYRIFK